MRVQEPRLLHDFDILIFLSPRAATSPAPRVWSSGLLKEHCPISGQLAFLTTVSSDPAGEGPCSPFSVPFRGWEMDNNFPG